MSNEVRSFIIIEPFMIDYKLPLTELVCYAIIHAFSKQKQGCFFGTQGYLAKQVGVSRQAVNKALISLESQGLINKNSRLNRIEYSTIVRENQSTTVDKEQPQLIDEGATTVAPKATTVAPKATTVAPFTINNIINTKLKDNIPPKSPKGGVRADEVRELYNSICLSLPKATTSTAKRKSATRALLKNYSLEQIKEIFERAEQSDFLCGKTGGGKWKASFDWLINSNNAAKVLDGNYGNKQETAGFADFLAEMERRDSLEKIKEEGGK